MKTTSTYEQQAIDFLNNTKTTLSIVFLKHAKHFSDDKGERDIYKCELKRGNRSYSFNFGQSINDSGVKIVNKNTGKILRVYDKSQYLKKDGVFSFDKFRFGCGWQFASCDIIVQPVAPSEYSILACLTKYDPGTFEDFCSEFGYDEDSKKAEATYKAVKEEYMAVVSLFTDEEIEQLQEIQ